RRGRVLQLRRRPADLPVVRAGGERRAVGPDGERDDHPGGRQPRAEEGPGERPGRGGGRAGVPAVLRDAGGLRVRRAGDGPGLVERGGRAEGPPLAGVLPLLCVLCASVVNHCFSEPADSCCVMQCSVPSPSTRSTQWTPTTSRPGNRSASVPSAARSIGSLNVGTITTPFAM